MMTCTRVDLLIVDEKPARELVRDRAGGIQRALSLYPIE